MRAMSSVLTLVGCPTARDLTARQVTAVADALHGLGAQVFNTEWLADHLAADIHFRHLAHEAARSAVAAVLAGAAVDTAVQPDAGRLKRLLVADMDSTIVTGETLNDLADQAGIGEQVAEITRRTMLGELPFEDSLRRRVALLEGLGLPALDEVVRRIALSPGARSLVRSLRAHGCYTVLCSGGFTFCTEPVAELCGFHEQHANLLLHADGRLTGRVAEPVLGRAAKVERLRRLLKERHLKAEEAAAVGDGANDIDLLRAVGLGVAYRGKPAVRQATPFRIDHSDLTAVCYFQGLREADLVL